jgi:hypothetical protein
MTQNYTLNKVYEFDLTGQVQFGLMPLEALYTLFQDGRVASKFLEHTIPVWFPDLVFEDGEGYDHRSLETDRRYDLKGFTRGGASYAPSMMLGAGRKIDIKALHEHASTIDYIFSDITEFPKVRIVFKRGTDLVEQFPSGKIAPKHKQTLFG